MRSRVSRRWSGWWVDSCSGRRTPYHVDGDGDPLTTVSVEGDEADLASLADELAVRILTGSGGSASRLAREAGRSGQGVPLEAWKEYFEGEEAYRAGRFAEATAEFRDAVAIDSGFALAHYRRSSAAGWAERHEEAAEALAQALAHSDRLAPLDRDLVEAAAAYRSGEHAEAKRRFEDITRAYPGDLEAWYGLGEVFFHYGWLGGDPVSRADSALKRASELDPAGVTLTGQAERSGVTQGTAPTLVLPAWLLCTLIRQ